MGNESQPNERRPIFAAPDQNWLTLMTDRMFGWSPTPPSSSNLHFDTRLDHADVPLEFARRHPDTPSEEIKHLYVKPFTDAVIPRCAF